MLARTFWSFWDFETKLLQPGQSQNCPCKHSRSHSPSKGRKRDHLSPSATLLRFEHVWVRSCFKTWELFFDSKNLLKLQDSHSEIRSKNQDSQLCSFWHLHQLQVTHQSDEGIHKVADQVPFLGWAESLSMDLIHLEDVWKWHVLMTRFVFDGHSVCIYVHVKRVIMLYIYIHMHN